MYNNELYNISALLKPSRTIVNKAIECASILLCAFSQSYHNAPYFPFPSVYFTNGGCFYETYILPDNLAPDIQSRQLLAPLNLYVSDYQGRTLKLKKLSNLIVGELVGCDSR